VYIGIVMDKERVIFQPPYPGDDSKDPEHCRTMAIMDVTKR